MKLQMGRLETAPLLNRIIHQELETVMSNDQNQSELHPRAHPHIHLPRRM